MTHKRREHDDVNPETISDIAEAASDESSVEGMESTDEMRVALAQCRKELAETKNDFLRAHADFDNFRKRMRAERNQEFARGSDAVLCELLCIVDDFERALAAVNDTSTVESLQAGISLIHRQMLALLERHNIKPMGTEGKLFDPKYHDAVAQVAAPGVPEHTIVGEILRGYVRGHDVFRPAKVAVAVTEQTADDDTNF